MQRTIDATLVNQILVKYENRLKECQDRWDEDYKKLQSGISEAERDYLLIDVDMQNAQISAYECVVKDLKKLVK